MPEERIPFLPNQETGWEELAGAGQVAMNVVVDGKGAVRRRPGIEEYFNVDGTVVDAAGISNIYSTVGGKLYVLSEGSGTKNVYRVSPSGISQISGVVPGSERPVFAETQSLLTIAAGAKIQKITLSNDTLERLGGDPPESTYVVANASRLLNLEITNPDLRDNINYSAPQAGAGIDGYETWNGVGDSGSFPANARPDPNVALAENTNEIFVFGSSNLQTFAPDQQQVYGPVNTREFGCSAPYSVIKDDQNFAWLDDRRRVVHSDGRTFNILSDPIKQTLDSMDDVSDAFGYRVVRGAVDALVWSFPSDGRTFAFQRGGGWSQWSSWDPDRNNWGPFIVTCLTSQLADAENIVGLSNGRMGKIRTRAATDLGNNINSYVTTGFIDHGTQLRKRCIGVRLNMRRGTSTKTTTPVALLSWRDDTGAWNPPLEVSLGTTGERNPVVRFWSLGVYRERQWRLNFMGDDELVVASVTEEYEVLSN